MTREEAIRKLRKHQPNDCCLESISLKVAIDMAIKALEQEPCEDAISRQIISDYVQSHIQEINTGYGDLNKHTNEILRMIVDYIETMSPVNPQEPKTGHWIMIDKELQRYICSECGEVIKLYKKSEISKLEKDETLSDYPFSHCGAKMVEPQESEDKE